LVFTLYVGGNITPRAHTPQLISFTPPATPEVVRQQHTPLRPRDEGVTVDVPTELAFHIELVFLMGWCASNRSTGINTSNGLIRSNLY
jgi:hypothetical protein